MTIGGPVNSAAEKARTQRDEAERLRARADRLEANADLWQQGAEGETTTAELLSPLAHHGWALLNDRSIPGSAANIDHVLIGPAGVIVIDTKNFTGRVHLSANGTLWHNRLPMNHELAALSRYGNVVADVVVTVRPGVPMFRVLCIHGVRMGPTFEVDGTVVLSGGQLMDWLRSLPPLVPLTAVVPLREAVMNRLPPKIRSEPSASRPLGVPGHSRLQNGSPWPPVSPLRGAGPGRSQRQGPNVPDPGASRPAAKTRRQKAGQGRVGALIGVALMFLVLVFVAHHMNGVGKAVATLADGPGTTVPAVPITGQFSCQPSSHTYLLTTRSASGTLRIVDAQTPRGVEEAVPGGSGFVDDLTSGETVALSVETSAQGPWSPPSTLMAPDQAC